MDSVSENDIKEFELFLKKLDDDNSITKEQAIFRKISDYCSDDFLNKYKPASYEYNAFKFAENYQDKKFGWDTYFGPFAIWQKDGDYYATPSISDIKKETLEYWENRSNECKNPIMIARYSGLVYDFSEKIISQKPDFKLVKKYITALIEISDKSLASEEFSVKAKLKLALNICIKYKIKDLKETVIQQIIKHEDKIAEDKSPGFWGFSFDLLVLNDKVLLSPEDENKIINDLENRFYNLLNKKDDPWTAEYAVNRLAVYYDKKKDKEKLQNLIGDYTDKTLPLIEKLHPLQASNHLEVLQKLNAKYGFTEKSNQLLILIEKNGLESLNHFAKIQQEVKFPNKILKPFLKELTKDGLKNAFISIILALTPKKDKVSTDLIRKSKETPLTYLFQRQVVDDTGRILFKLETLEKDLEGNIVYELSQQLYFESIIIDIALREIKDKFDIQESDILEFVKESNLISDDKIAIIEAAINAYLNNQHIVFIHLIIPQIEGMVRRLLKLIDVNTRKPLENGGYQEITFEALLRNEDLIKALGEDFSFYFRVLFTDQRGWNLRNNICHGLVPSNKINQKMADRVLHAFMYLGLLRINENTN